MIWEDRFIIHIPHASTLIPEGVVYKNNQKVTEEINQSTDWFTDQLFFIGDGAQYIKAPYSRLFLDVERLSKNDPSEQYGRGLKYTKFYDNSPVEYISDNDILRQNTYIQHWENYENAIQNCLNKWNFAIVIDAHSFNDIPLPFETWRTKEAPDICLGIDSGQWTPVFKDTFEQFKFTVDINYPYKGVAIPEKYNKDDRVVALMIEVNKRTYLDNPKMKKNNVNDALLTALDFFNFGIF